jgi:NAD-dependent deacetylase
MSALSAARERLQRADRVCVLTGAGMSRESGIPTFREAQRGLWAQFDPQALASPEGFAANPERVWRWYQWRLDAVRAAVPHAGHLALARFARGLTPVTIVTQNVDGLHQRADAALAADAFGDEYPLGGESGAAPTIIELHGQIARTICHRTRRPIDAAWLQRYADEHPPRSPHALDGFGRPDVVWFGEALNPTTLAAAQSAMRCEVLLIVGTSGLVWPAAGLPGIAAAAGATLIEVNPDCGQGDFRADLELSGTAAEILPLLLSR